MNKCLALMVVFLVGLGVGTDRGCIQQHAPAMAADIGPLVEEEERHVLSTSPEQVCTADGRQVSAFSCSLEEAESDQVIFRGGSGVSSSDGVQYCDACRRGARIDGNSRSTYLLATSGTPAVRCLCGYR